MWRPGFLDMLSLTAGLVLAIPMAIIGFEMLRQGQRAFGLAFLGLAIALVWLPEYVRHRLPRPGRGIKRRLTRRFPGNRED